jgi:hypothetical protein
MQQRINEAALAAGRQPQDIRRIYNIMGLITPGARKDFLIGPVDSWVDELTRLVVEVGMDTFMYWPASVTRIIDRCKPSQTLAVQVRDFFFRKGTHFSSFPFIYSDFPIPNGLFEDVTEKICSSWSPYLWDAIPRL